MTSSTTSPDKFYFIQNLYLLEKFKSYFENSDLKSKFNYSLIFSTLSSNYLLFTEIRDINLYSYLKESPEFFLKKSDNPTSNDMSDMNILSTYLKEEISNYSFLYYILTIFVILQSLTFYANEHDISEETMSDYKNLSLEDIYDYFCKNNSLEYYQRFAYDRYFYFPLTCDDMYSLTNSVITTHPNLTQLFGLLKSYEL